MGNCLEATPAKYAVSPLTSEEILLEGVKRSWKILLDHGITVDDIGKSLFDSVMQEMKLKEHLPFIDWLLKHSTSKAKNKNVFVHLFESILVVLDVPKSRYKLALHHVVRYHVRMGFTSALWLILRPIMFSSFNHLVEVKLPVGIWLPADSQNWRTFLYDLCRDAASMDAVCKSEIGNELSQEELAEINELPKQLYESKPVNAVAPSIAKLRLSSFGLSSIPVVNGNMQTRANGDSSARTAPLLLDDRTPRKSNVALNNLSATLKANLSPRSMKASVALFSENKPLIQVMPAKSRQPSAEILQRFKDIPIRKVSSRNSSFSLGMSDGPIGADFGPDSALLDVTKDSRRRSANFSNLSFSNDNKKSIESFEHERRRSGSFTLKSSYSSASSGLGNIIDVSRTNSSSSFISAPLYFDGGKGRVLTDLPTQLAFSGSLNEIKISKPPVDPSLS